MRPEVLRELSWSRLEPASARSTTRSHEAWPCYRFGSYRNTFLALSRVTKAQAKPQVLARPLMGRG